MVSTEVQRTLVKSPPELWAELSDPAALARHLGDLGDIGEIQITRIHAEERVEWEGNRISGTVLMKASGWGTKVTLRVSRELSMEPAAAAEEATPVDKADESETHAAPETPEAQPAAAEQPDGEPPAADSQASANDEVSAAIAPEQRAPRRGFFSRLFRRRRQDVQSEAQAQPEDTAPAEASMAGAEPLPATPAAEAVAVEVPPEPVAATEPPTEPQTVEPTPQGACDADAPPLADPDAPAADISAELKDAEEAATERVTAVLTATLDRLGAAHHRPFSRA